MRRRNAFNVSLQVTLDCNLSKTFTESKILSLFSFKLFTRLAIPTNEFVSIFKIKLKCVFSDSSMFLISQRFFDKFDFLLLFEPLSYFSHKLLKVSHSLATAATVDSNISSFQIDSSTINFESWNDIRVKFIDLIVPLFHLSHKNS